MSRGDFPRRLVEHGFGDPYNHYAHSSCWFKDHLMVGTSRANLQFLRLGKLNVEIPRWPVSCRLANYSPEFEEHVAAAEIWRIAPGTSGTPKNERVYQSPFHPSSEGVNRFRSEIHYRSMCAFLHSAEDHTLYVATTSRSRGDGPDLLASKDGRNFVRLPKPLPDFCKGSDQGEAAPRFTSIRNLIQFDDLLITCVTGGSRGHVNYSLNSQIFGTLDPSGGAWTSLNGSGFGSYPKCSTVYTLCVHNGCLYAGTGGIEGFSLYRGIRTGPLCFDWTLVADRGGGRGALNQGVVSMCSHEDHLYIGTGIQNGGYDRTHQIGPAAFEMLRLDNRDHLSVVVGDSREGKAPLSGFRPGFGNPFNAYLWEMASHQGWIYAGTHDTSVFSLFTDDEKKKLYFADKMDISVLLEWLRHHGGADLWRSRDGVAWEPVTRNGFDNFYNYGVRKLVSRPEGLYVGTANPFGPEVWDPVQGHYVANRRAGLEVLFLPMT